MCVVCPGSKGPHGRWHVRAHRHARGWVVGEKKEEEDEEKMTIVVDSTARTAFGLTKNKKFKGIKGIGG